MANALQITAPAPACYQSDGLYPDVGARISRVAGDAAWPCISRTERSSVEFSLQSNSAPAWIVSTKPAWDVQYPTTLGLASAIASATWLNTAPNRAHNALLLSESAVNFTAERAEDTLIRMEVDPVMSQVRTAALAVDIFLPDEAAETLNKATVSKTLCKRGHSPTKPAALAWEPWSAASGPGVGGVVGAVLGIVVDGASALWTQLEGLVRTAMRTDDITFEIDQIPVDSAPGTSIPEAVAKSMAGTWTGPVDQPGSRDYSVILSLRQQGDTLVGSVEYPELECSGYLHRAHIVDDKLLIQETISKNGSCVEEVGLDCTYAMANWTTTLARAQTNATQHSALSPRKLTRRPHDSRRYFDLFIGGSSKARSIFAATNSDLPVIRRFDSSSPDEQAIRAPANITIVKPHPT